MVVVIAQGLGCLIAIQALADAAAVGSMALLAPVVSGRSYLRELAMWSSMIDDGLGLRPGQRMAEAGQLQAWPCRWVLLMLSRRSILQSWILLLRGAFWCCRDRAGRATAILPNNSPRLVPRWGGGI